MVWEVCGLESSWFGSSWFGKFMVWKFMVWGVHGLLEVGFIPLETDSLPPDGCLGESMTGMVSLFLFGHGWAGFLSVFFPSAWDRLPSPGRLLGSPWLERSSFFVLRHGWSGFPTFYLGWTHLLILEDLSDCQRSLEACFVSRSPSWVGITWSPALEVCFLPHSLPPGAI